MGVPVGAEPLPGRRIGIGDRRQVNGSRGLLDFPIDAKMIPSEGSRPEDSNARFAGQTDALARLSLRLNGAQALRVESQKLRYLIVGLAGRAGDKARRGRRCPSRTRCPRHKLQQIQSDVFIPARAVAWVYSLFHIFSPTA